MLQKKIQQKIINKYNDMSIILFGRLWQIILINEFPKCGASWLKSMIYDLIKEDGYVINKNNDYVPPIKPKYLMQRHWLKYYRYAFKTIVLLRDPRDAYNSFYFFENYYSPSQSKKQLFQFNENDDDRENMYRYLKMKLLYPERSTPGFSYKSFWQEIKNKDGIYILKYENLKNNTFDELKRILDFLEFKKNNDSIIEAIENHSIIKMQKSEKVKDEKQRFVRKGIVGDWKNNFNRKSKELLKKELGETLIEMGYEQDFNW